MQNNGFVTTFTCYIVSYTGTRLMIKLAYIQNAGCNELLDANCNGYTSVIIFTTAWQLHGELFWYSEYRP